MRKKILIGVALLLATTLNAHASFSFLNDEEQWECDQQIVFFTDANSILSDPCKIHYRRSRMRVFGWIDNVLTEFFTYRVTEKTRWSDKYQTLDEDNLPIHPSLEPRNPMMQTRD